MNQENHLTIKQAAELSGVSIKTIRRALKGGKIQAFNVGKGKVYPRWRIFVSELSKLKK